MTQRPGVEFGEREEAALWRRMKEDGSADARERLFSAYLPYARQIALRHYRQRSGREIEFQDLRQLACTGLLEAIDRFDPDRGVPFRGYAARRISGSVLNGIAKLSEVREQISFRNRIRAERLRSLSAGGEGSAGAADAMQALADLAVGLALGFMLDGSGLVVGGDEVDRRPTAYESLAWKDLLRRVHAELQALPHRERLIIRGHYLEGMDFQQLSALLGVSKGRVSQLHRAALNTIRVQLGKTNDFILQR